MLTEPENEYKIYSKKLIEKKTISVRGSPRRGGGRRGGRRVGARRANLTRDVYRAMMDRRSLIASYGRTTVHASLFFFEHFITFL